MQLSLCLFHPIMVLYSTICICLPGSIFTRMYLSLTRSFLFCAHIASISHYARLAYRLLCPSSSIQVTQNSLSLPGFPSLSSSLPCRPLLQIITPQATPWPSKVSCATHFEVPGTKHYSTCQIHHSGGFGDTPVRPHPASLPALLHLRF